MSDVDTAGEHASTSDGPQLETPSGPPSWVTVARKDVAVGARSWQLYVLTGVFTAAMLLVVGKPLQQESPAAGSITGQAGMHAISSIVGTFFPLIILGLVHMAIVGERRRGSLRVLLGLPISRREVFVGTLVGRTVVVGGTVLAALAVNGLLMVALYDSVDVGAYALFSIAVVAFCTLFVMMGVGISAAVRTRGRAIGLAIGGYVLSQAGIAGIVEAGTGVEPTNKFTTQDIAPGWIVLLERLRPAYGWRLVVTDWIVPVLTEFGGFGDETYYALRTTEGPEPFYLDSWFLALALILLWGCVPVLIGYWRFRTADIG